jgi:hypothetical protein
MLMDTLACGAYECVEWLRYVEKEYPQGEIFCYFLNYSKDTSIE